MARRSLPESLELLLDTMCNTFGGVMFIAITLAVVLFSSEAVRNAASPEERSAQRIEQLQEQIDALRRKLKEVAERQRELRQAARMMERDPRLKSLKQIAYLEQLVNTETVHESLMQKELGVVTMQLVRENDEKRKNVEEADRLKAELERLTVSMEEDRKLLESLSYDLQKASTLSMTFTTLETRKEAAYFILLRRGHLWQIGPVYTQGQTTEPVKDVTFTVKDGNRFVCTPKEDCGIPALEGDRLSAECLEMLRKIPKGRIAHFNLAKEDSEVFYKMRELLKRDGILHGFKIEKQNDTLEYVLRRNVNYEY